jgi:hypothetical protein
MTIKRKQKSAKRKAPEREPRWSSRVTRESHALALEDRAFKKSSAKAIAQSLKRSAEQSDQRKSSRYRSAMSMLTFYVNRAGKNLPERRRAILEHTKGELRELFGR